MHLSSELYEGSGLLAKDLGSSLMKTIDEISMGIIYSLDSYAR